MYRLLILESPYFSLEHSVEARKYFADIVPFKVSGYLSKYIKAIPLGLDDFLADHILIIDDADRIVAGIKHMDIKTMKYFNTEFPMFKWLRDSCNNRCTLDNFNEYLEYHKHDNVGYVGSYTKARNCVDGKFLARLISVGIAKLAKRKNSKKLIAVGMTYGMPFIEKLGGELLFQEKIRLKCFNYEEAHISVVNEYSLDIQEDMIKLDNYWRNRKHFYEKPFRFNEIAA